MSKALHLLLEGQTLTGCGRKIGPYDCCTVVCGDCLELMRNLPDGCVDAVITDPPYGIGFSEFDVHKDDPALYEGMMKEAVSRAERACRDGAALFWWQGMPRAADWHKWFPSTFRIMASCKDFVQMWFQIRVQYSFDPIIFWYKAGIEPKGRATGSRIENAKERRWDWHIARTSQTVNDTLTKGIHPCQKAINAVETVVFCASNEGETILDPFLGSGTTAVAAKKLGRHFLGFEISPDYCKIAEDRIALVEAQPNLFEKKPEQGMLIA